MTEVTHQKAVCADGGAAGLAVDPFDPNSFKAATISKEDAASVPSPAAEENKPTVKLLVFDMGHVFVKFNWDDVCQSFCDRSSMPRESFKSVLAHVGGLGYEVGRCDTKHFVSELNSKLGTTLTEDEFAVLWNATFEEDPEMAAFLGELGKKYPLYLLSNTNEVHYAHLQDNFNVARHFKELILSFQVGLAKPNRLIYEEVLKRSGLAAAECIFIDDLAVNIAAARDLVGMHTIQFVGIDDLKVRLAEYGVSW